MKRRLNFLRYHWPWIAWLIGILIVTGIPGKYVPHVISFEEWMKPDKLLHILLFAVLVFLSLRSFMMQYKKMHQRLIYVGVLLVSISIGGITELMQSYLLTGRNGNVYDFGADALGCLTGLFIFNLVKQKFLEKI